MKDMRLWVDIETTGLDPKEGAILEVGIILTDKYGNIESTGEWLTYPGPNRGITSVTNLCDSFVTEMHEKSGLFEDMIFEGGFAPQVLTYREAQRAISDWFENEGIPKAALPMCGSSVHFDRAWLKEHLPAVEAQFTYRNIDVSTLRELCKDLNPRVYAAISELPTKGEHRAIPDLEDTLALYQFLLDNFLFVAP